MEDQNPSSQCFINYASSCTQVKNAYINFLNHCYVDTEVEMKEIYTSNHIWTLFEDFLVDMARVRLQLLSFTMLLLSGCFSF